MTPPRRRSNRLSAAQTAAAASTKSPPPTTRTTTKKKRGSSAKKQTSSTKKKRRTGLKTAIVDPSAALGVVDPESGINGAIEVLVGEPCDAMLVLVDPAKNMDKFFILQLIKRTKSMKEGSYVVYTRWGRTGTSGQALEQNFEEFDDAVDCFEEKFKQKTGLEWENRNEPTIGKKYRLIKQNFEEKQGGFNGAKWQYWVDDGVDGKTDGWYDYAVDGSVQVERLFQEHSLNAHLTNRLVESGCWTYDVNLIQMIQTNVKHLNKTSRRIRRCPVGVEMDNASPHQLLTPVSSSCPVSPVTSAAAAVRRFESGGTKFWEIEVKGLMTHILYGSMGKTGRKSDKQHKDNATAENFAAKKINEKLSSGYVEVGSSLVPAGTSAAPLPALVTPTSSPTKAPAKNNGSPSKRPPVDVDIDIFYKATPSTCFVVAKDDNDEWCDVVLNQCNITGGNNNNKYYRLQLLDKAGEFYVWMKWGRVGETPKASAKDLKGGFSTMEAALKVFAKKYRDKTGNVFGSNAVPKKGKYTPIQIDNDVEVKEELKMVDVKSEDIEYFPSSLDPKTRELIEVLFSKETRDEALSSFNLDLKRLPLGVPSKQQIEIGVEILNEIEDKLGGGNVSESFSELSSRFYTAIPHSFGRNRPPIITSKNQLQERYDMTNILFDMFSTNETLHKIEKEAKKKTTKVPYPADSHYDSLNADLSLVDKNTKEYKQIVKYFNSTKGCYSRARLLDVWQVDRNGEKNRFEEYDELDNRKLLWHGTNIAVAAPIITSGLRIMPHSGGRVGAGIYLASMHEKSASYTSAYGARFACMFLCEGALGKTHPVTSDGSHASSLKKAPKGFDSVHAIGTTTPRSWTSMKIDGKDVEVPNASGGDSGTTSSFHHDEYLVYNEAQVRLRYILALKLH